ncbi:Aste57867_24258 [Aphanomyces stellatus]|uniref:Aste57867_24258 protein n=1 Tax=Aphanomyces stellatus TaxID=120398 RepID=A0A485LQP5_9STRA|nr:hypothetical protein As57867_024183 [Aphanomyces stellatus]VFU00898.1 Aste57867_24258 [Aphanomyces stellatus]
MMITAADEPDFLHASSDCLLPPEAWVNKKERFRCHVCAQKFNNLFRRRNHCRLCGELFCKQCIVHKFVHVVGREKVSVKVCTPCAYEDAENHGKRRSPRLQTSRRLLQMRATTFESTTGDLLSSPSEASIGDRHRRDSHRTPHTYSSAAASASTVSSLRRSLCGDSRGDLDFEESFYQGRYDCPSAPCMIDEIERVNALKALQILYTAPEETFNVICELAATTLHCPMSIVSFMDLERQWFKAKMGMTKNSFSRRVSFCAHAIASATPTVVLDTTLDPRFTTNPLVVDYGIRFYASVPLVTSDGWVVGTLAAFDYHAHLSCDASSLVPLAKGIMQQLEERRVTRQVRRRRQASSFDERCYAQTATTPVPPLAAMKKSTSSSSTSQLHHTPTLGPQRHPASHDPQALLLGGGVGLPQRAESAPASPQLKTLAAPPVKMESILIDLLHKTSETQQQLAVQQDSMFATLSNHSEQIGKLAEALARMESKLE